MLVKTFVLGGNHGQYLQAKGMQEILHKLSMGNSVYFSKYNNHVYKEIIQQTRSLQLYKYLRMRNEWSRNFNFAPFDMDSDLIVYGSDQIWNFSSTLFQADPYFFGDSTDALQVSYAPSMGGVEKGFIIPSSYCKKLDNIDHISVRDYPTAEVIRNNLKRDVSVVIDPAFFLGNNIQKSSQRENVLSVYCPRSALTVPAFESMCSKDLNFDAISYYGYCPKNKLTANYLNQSVMPMELLDKIAASKFLLTSTFHGVVMALMTKTPFLAIQSKSLENRLNAPVFERSFSKKRVVPIAEIQNIKSNYLRELFSDEDLLQEPITNNLNISKEWLTSSIGAEG